MYIHIFTSTSGGKGKTMCALSATRAHVSFPMTVSAIDINWHNSDLAKVLSMGTLPQNDPQIPVARWTPAATVVVERPRNPFTLPDGAAWVWQFLLAATERNNNGNNGSTIVDTCLHPLNILDIPNNIIEDVLQSLSSIDNVTIYVWFIWSLSGLYDDLTQFELGNPAFRLDNVIDHWNGMWHQMTKKATALISPIHVVSPHAMYPYGDLIGFIRGSKNVTINGLDWIRKMSPKRHDMTFGELSTLMGTTVNLALHVENRFNDFARGLSIEYKGRPRNLFAISCYSTQAIDFPTYFFIDPATAISGPNSIVRHFEVMAEQIKRYLKFLYFGDED